jgi:hypothetical protein
MVGRQIRTLAELGLRAQTLVALLLLDEVLAAIVHSGSQCRHMFSGRFRCIQDVVDYLFEALPAVTAIWLPTRSSPDEVEHHAAIRLAQEAMRRITDDVDFGNFLRVGSDCVELPDVRFICEELKDTFAISLPIKPFPVLLLS